MEFEANVGEGKKNVKIGLARKQKGWKPVVKNKKERRCVGGSSRKKKRQLGLLLM